MHAQEPALLQIKVVEGDGAAYATGSRATRGITVQVTDEGGRPVDGATISFKLPEEGPSGSFITGSKTAIATTRAEGQASAWGMQWNRTAGLVEIRVTAAKGQVRAGIVCSQYLRDSPGGQKSGMGSGGSHKWIWIAVGIVAVAGGAAAGVVVSGKSSSSTTAPTGLQIGAPTITLGH